MCHTPDAHEHPHSRPGWKLKTCDRCGFIYLQDPPGYQEFSDDFAWEKTSKAERSRRRNEEPLMNRASKVLRHLRRRLATYNKLHTLLSRFVPSGRLLDIGCGRGGRMLDCFGERYEPWGVEISAALAKTADELFSRYGGHCIHNDAISGLNNMPEGHFDGVIMRSYLEHEMEPRGVCLAVFRSLKPGGHVVIKVPNHASWNRVLRGAKWCGYRFPDHVNYFTPQSLKGLMKETGFRIVQFGLFDRLVTSDNMWLVARKPAD